MKVRALNKKGLQAFGEYLVGLRAGSNLEPPRRLLTDSEFLQTLRGRAEIENLDFARSLEAGRYITEALKPLDRSEVDRNAGLWSWLSLFFFDQVCPVNTKGQRVPGQVYRHILDPGFHYHYRHLLAGPFNIFRLHGETAPLLLFHPVHKVNKFCLEFSSRQGFITNKGVIEAANILYYDPDKKRPKPGAAVTTRRPGVLFRFIDVIQQLDLTHDLYSLSGQEILTLLPPEFEQWRP